MLLVKLAIGIVAAEADGHRQRLASLAGRFRHRQRLGRQLGLLLDPRQAGLHPFDRLNNVVGLLEQVGWQGSRIRNGHRRRSRWVGQFGPGAGKAGRPLRVEQLQQGKDRGLAGLIRACFEVAEAAAYPRR